MCCLFGLIDYNNTFSAKEKNKIIGVLSKECEARGTDATGISYNSAGNLRIFKRPVPAHRMWYRIPTDVKVIMGHTRMTTQGSEKLNFNNHPFYGRVDGMDFAFAHNGVLHNDVNLKLSEKLPPTHIQTDSYVAVQLLEKENSLSFDSIRKMAEKTSGSFCYTILNDKNDTYFVKGDNPLALYKFDGFYIYASTDEILQKALKKLKLYGYSRINISCGDILFIDRTGAIEVQHFEYPDYFSDRLLCDYYTHNYTFQNNDYIEDLMEYASFFGIEAEDIVMLMDYGYDETEIEEMLYEPIEMQNCISELRMMERELC